jgi:hypothetical protein
MTGPTSDTMKLLAGFFCDDPRDAAKLAYLATIGGDNRPGPTPKPKRPKTGEQLVSPAEHIELALISVIEEAASLRALLTSPDYLATHKGRAIDAVKQIQAEAQRAQSCFHLVKSRCIHKEVYSRKRDAK